MAEPVEFSADARRGCMKHTKITLSATPNTVTVVDLPKDAKGYGIYPEAATIEHNVNAAPQAVTPVGTTDQDAVASDEYDGGYAFAGQWMWRLVEPYSETNTVRQVHLMSATASAVLYLETF